MAERLRSVDTEPAKIPAVDAVGNIKLIPMAPGITGAIVAVTKDRNGDINFRLSPEHESAGWSLLEDLYKAENRRDLYVSWQDHYKMLIKAKKMRQEFPNFPEKYLPREVQNRRKGIRSDAIKWEMPDLKPVE